MKQLVFFFFTVLVGLWTTDRIGGAAMGWAFCNSCDVLAPKLRYIENGIHEDIVFMGASRCHHHYVPQIIADTLGMSVYNAGVGGANNIFSHYVLLCHILNKHKPKVICLEVMPTDYNLQVAPFSSLSFFAPLFGKNDAADSVYLIAGLYWKYKVSHLFRYNAKAPSILWGLVINRQLDGDKGYIPLPCPKQHSILIDHEILQMEIDTLKLDYFKRFIGLCQRNNIKLVLTVSPKYTRVDSEHYVILKRLAEHYDIPFMDYHTEGLYLDHPEYFKDTTHLWDDGARHFSRLFAADLAHLLLR